MIHKHKKFTCPWCFEQYSLMNIVFRCTHSACPPEPDVLLAEYLGEDPQYVERGPVVESNNTWFQSAPQRATCSGCHKSTSDRICPGCHNPLPYTVGDFEDKIFAIIGAKESGKSHYIAVLINALRHQVAPAFNCSLTAMDDATISRYEHAFYQPVFKEHRTLNATLSASANTDIRQPLVYSFVSMKKNWRGQSVTNKAATLSFFDTAGEDLLDEQKMRQFTRYISNAQGLILLLDPLQIPAVRDRLGLEPLLHSAQESILDRTINLIRKERDIPAGQSISIPIALTFSKLDAIESILEPSSPLHQDSLHLLEKQFDTVDFDAVQAELKLMLESWGQGGTIQSLEHHFKEHALFGLSALGGEPENGKIKHFRKQRRVSDPLLWLFWKHQLLT